MTALLLATIGAMPGALVLAWAIVAAPTAIVWCALVVCTWYVAPELGATLAIVGIGGASRADSYQSGIGALARALVAVPTDHNGRPVTSATLAKRLRAAGHALGAQFNPCGDGDVKTASPGTYRPVGSTCPDSCPLLGICYAVEHNVGQHQRASSAHVDVAIDTAILAMVWAVRTDRLARLHVSGDLGKSWADAADYVNGLIEAADAINDALGRARGSSLAWSYTHLDPDIDGVNAINRLHEAGIHVRFSDVEGHNGAIVAPFERVTRAYRKAASVPLAKCPAQLRDVSCVDCRLCWERPDVCIVFDPHGANKRLVARIVTGGAS